VTLQRSLLITFPTTVIDIAIGIGNKPFADGGQRFVVKTPISHDMPTSPLKEKSMRAKLSNVLSLG
jgi:hypothetical protein